MKRSDLLLCYISGKDSGRVVKSDGLLDFPTDLASDDCSRAGYCFSLITVCGCEERQICKVS